MRTTYRKPFPRKGLLYLLLIIALAVSPACNQLQDHRNVTSLNGTWDFTVQAEGESVPTAFEAEVPVPGLGDLATIDIDSLGLQTSGKRNLWYRKHFRVNFDEGALVQLKIHKVKFGHTVYVNGNEVGGSDHCFTPGIYDIADYLQSGETNELVVRVGAYIDNLETPAVYGADFEKLKYLPGIYDDVELIVTGKERITNVQIAPDPDDNMVRLQVQLDVNEAEKLQYEIADASSGAVMTKGTLRGLTWEDQQALAEVRFSGFTLWTPENPQLYTLRISTADDTYTTRFGMRSFGFNTETNLAELNGETYFMRGTNICIFRFFEDPDRAALPWDTAWVRNLHRKFKTMHWNSIRYCISTPPAFWYDIADEEGLLIQDEYPVWTGINIDGRNGFEVRYPDITPAMLAEEYREWMAERWNHPCVVIWDAQNESVTPVTGEAIGMVRDLDLSGRPWENGWARPQSPGDPMETHPYRFTKFMGRKASAEGPLKEVISEPQLPDNGPSERMPPEDGGKYSNPIIINEYGWLWLNRDGSTTTLTDKVYPNAFGEGLTTPGRLEIYGRHLGILTEYWRAHRKCAGVLHFCGLAYSRSDVPRGQTSDHFVDIAALTFEENFVKYVKPAFNPVGVFIDWFERTLAPGELCEVPVIVINDLNREVSAQLALEWVPAEGKTSGAGSQATDPVNEAAKAESLEAKVGSNTTKIGNTETKVRSTKVQSAVESNSGESVSQYEHEISGENITLSAFEKLDKSFTINAPTDPGHYELVLKIAYDDQVVKSIRQVEIRLK